MGSSAYFLIDYSKALILDRHGVRSGGALPSLNLKIPITYVFSMLFVHPGASGLTLSVDSTDLVGNASALAGL